MLVISRQNSKQIGLIFYS